jgi:hypothetical protein
MQHTSYLSGCCVCRVDPNTPVTETFEEMKVGSDQLWDFWLRAAAATYADKHHVT